VPTKVNNKALAVNII